MRKLINLGKVAIEHIRLTAASAALVAANYVTHLCVSIYLLYEPNDSRTSTLAKTLPNATGAIVAYEAKLLIVFACVYALISVFERSYRGRFSFLVPLSVFSFVHLSTALAHPQLYDDIGRVGELLPLVIDRLRPRTLAAGGFLVALNFLIASRASLSARNSVPRILFVLFLACIPLLHFASWRFPGSAIAASSRNSTKPAGLPKSIVILSVDSLNENHEFGPAPHDSPLARFQAEARQIRQVVTPQPQTHVSLASLFREQLPMEHGLRNYLQRDESLDPEFYVGPSLRELRERGYRIAFLLDTQLFMLFDKSELLETYESPQQGVSSFIFPMMNRSAFFWTFLNNDLGRAIFPEIESNSDFSASYDLGPFADKVGRKIRELSASGRPYFLFVHTCALHWPAAAPYPYYRHARHSAYPYFSYGSRFHPITTPFTLSGPEWIERAQVNKRIYEASTEWVARDFLDPVIASLERNGAMSDAIIALISDHGEDFWTQGKYPAIRIPSHSQALLFSSRSERIRLDVKLPPGLPASAVAGFDESPLAVHSLLARFKDAALGKPHTPSKGAPFTYSESGLWLQPVFLGLLKLISSDSLKDAMRIEAGSLYVTTDFDLRAAVLEKVRSVQDRDLRLTVFPTIYGFQYILCKLAEDPGCEENIGLGDPALAARFLDRLNEFTSIDRAKDLVPAFRLDPSRPGFLIALRPKREDSAGKNPWIKYVRALESTFKYRNHLLSERLLDEVASGDSPAPLKAAAVDFLANRCGRRHLLGRRSLEILFERATRRYHRKRDSAIYAEDEDWEDEETVYFRCLRRLEASAHTLMAANRVPEGFRAAPADRLQAIALEYGLRYLDEASHAPRDQLHAGKPSGFQMAPASYFRQHVYLSLAPDRLGQLRKAAPSDAAAFRALLEEEFAIDLKQNFLTPLKDYWILRASAVRTKSEEDRWIAEVLANAQAPSKVFTLLISRIESRFPAYPSPRVLQRAGELTRGGKLRYLDVYRLQKSYIRYLLGLQSNGRRTDELDSLWRNWIAPAERGPAGAFLALAQIHETALERYMIDFGDRGGS